MKFLVLEILAIASGLVPNSLLAGPKFYSAKNNDKCFLCDYGWESCLEKEQYTVDNIERTFSMDNLGILGKGRKTVNLKAPHAPRPTRKRATKRHWRLELTSLCALVAIRFR